MHDLTRTQDSENRFLSWI